MRVKIDSKFTVDVNGKLGTGRHEHGIEILCLALL